MVVAKADHLAVAMADDWVGLLVVAKAVSKVDWSVASMVDSSAWKSAASMAVRMVVA